tara:strand:- start:2129 stop:2260 length:132 start_codon:yes stop_codon:yes gene_type:complete
MGSENKSIEIIVAPAALLDIPILPLTIPEFGGWCRIFLQVAAE